MSPALHMTVWSGRCPPVTEWPAPDQAAWATAHVAGNPFEPGGLAVRWALATRWMVANGYGLWLTWLKGRGWLDLQQSARGPNHKGARRRLCCGLAARKKPFHRPGSRPATGRRAAGDVPEG